MTMEKMKERMDGHKSRIEQQKGRWCSSVHSALSAEAKSFSRSLQPTSHPRTTSPKGWKPQRTNILRGSGWFMRWLLRKLSEMKFSGKAREMQRKRKGEIKRSCQIYFLLDAHLVLLPGNKYSKKRENITELRSWQSWLVKQTERDFV